MTLKAMRELGMTPERAVELTYMAHEAAQPFVRAKVAIMSAALPMMVIRAGQEAVITYAPDVQEQLDDIDRLWRENIASLMCEWQRPGSSILSQKS